ncbi:MAG: helix-turn-helix transcriptional regulator [bacterium]|nr:helix-turn-helix transcriptional regulator [bacterium]
MESLKPKAAAEILGISYPTIKQWIYDGKIESVKTPGGHHRIPASEIERLSGNKPELRRPDPKLSAMQEQISVRNRLNGVVTSISYEGLFAEVTVDVGGQRIVSIITRRGCEEMGLKVGMNAYALFKATEVMISRR